MKRRNNRKRKGELEIWKISLLHYEKEQQVHINKALVINQKIVWINQKTILQLSNQKIVRRNLKTIIQLSNQGLSYNCPNYYPSIHTIIQVYTTLLLTYLYTIKNKKGQICTNKQNNLISIIMNFLSHKSLDNKKWNKNLKEYKKKKLRTFKIISTKISSLYLVFAWGIWIISRNWNT